MLEILILVAWVAQSDSDFPVLRAGEVVTGELPVDAPVVRTPALSARDSLPARGLTYRLVGPESGPVTITLRGWGFDAYAVARDVAGRVLGEDDDGWYGPHARLVVAGASTIDVVGFGASGGAFELEMTIGVVDRPSEETRKEWRLSDARGLVKRAGVYARKRSLGAAQQLLRHATAIREDILGPAHPDAIDVRLMLATNHLELSQADEAEAILTQVLALCEEHLGPWHVKTLTCVSLLGASKFVRGLYAEAKELHEKAVSISERIHGADHEATATHLNDLAVVYHQMGAHDDALSLYRRVLEIRERELGPDHLRTVTTFEHLAALFRATGNNAEALPLARRALEVRESKSGPDAPETAGSLDVVARILQKLGRLEEARRMHERALAIRESMFGPDHPDTGLSLNNLGMVLHEQGAVDAATQLFERSLAINERVFGRAHDRTATSVNNLAATYSARGAFYDARRMLEWSLAIKEERLGLAHPSTLTTLGNLTSVLRDLGEFGAARQLAGRALAATRELDREDTLELAKLLASLASVLQSQGMYEDATPLFERALAIRRAALGPEDPTIALSLFQVGLLLLERREVDAAIARLEEAAVLFQASLGDHPTTGHALYRLAEAQRAAGDREHARRSCRRALQIWEEKLGPNHPLTSLAMQGVAMLLLDDGALEEAKRLFERAFEIWRDSRGRDHPETWNHIFNLATVNHLLGEHDEATRLAREGLIGLGRNLVRELTTLAPGRRLRVLHQQFRRIELLLNASRATATSTREVADLVLTWKGQAYRAARGTSPHGRGVVTDALVEHVRARSAQLSTLLSATRITDPERHDRELGRLRAELTTAEEDLLSQLDRDGDWRTVDVSTVISALPDDAALVDVLVHGAWTQVAGSGVLKSTAIATAFVYRPDRDVPVRVELGRVAALGDAIRRHPISFGASRGVSVAVAVTDDLVDTSDPGEELRRLVWDPLVPHLEGVDHVIVSPDGVLGTMPFEVLPDGNGGYLVESLRFTYLTDAGTLVRMNAPDRPAPGTGVLAAGGIDYSERGVLSKADLVAVANLRGPTDGGVDRLWASLGATRDEAALVTDLHALREEISGSAVLLTGPEATEEAVKRALPGRRFVHIATHGYFQPEGLPSMWENLRGEGRDVFVMRAAPEEVRGLVPGLLSGLVFAGANRPVADRENGLLTANEVSWIDLAGCELVVLSACQTALGESRAGEGILSLQRAFHTAGVSTVIASLWKVPDRETAQLMQDFYSRLWLRGEAPGDALRGAQLDMIRRNRTRGEGARPATWGAFVLSGDWRSPPSGE